MLNNLKPIRCPKVLEKAHLLHLIFFTNKKEEQFNILSEIDDIVWKNNSEIILLSKHVT